MEVVRSILAYAALCICLVGVCNAAGDPTEKLNGVFDLTSETFSSYVNGGKAALVEFYAPWCGHCKHLVPEYKKLGELVQSDPKLKNRVVIAKVDADAHRSVGQQFGVQGFPTIKFFPRGKAATKENVKDYSGPRTAEAFVSFLLKELDADAGFARVSVLQDLVAGFVDAKDKKAIIEKVSAKVSELAADSDDAINGQTYIKVLEKAADKGGDYLAKEKARLEKMLSSGSVASSKVEELSRKLSVISSILEAEPTTAAA